MPARRPVHGGPRGKSSTKSGWKERVKEGCAVFTEPLKLRRTARLGRTETKVVSLGRT